MKEGTSSPRRSARKGRIRQFRQQRMKSAGGRGSQASHITNPTHYSVALTYDAAW
jgi:flagellar biosynthesis protein FlhB